MFSKVLVANRGEIACRVVRTCRKLGVRTVAIYSDADQGSLHTELADEAVRVGPAPVHASYLQIDAIVAAARSTGAQAVHPGYGLLSERAAFARAVTDAGLVFIGPPPDVLAALGDKMSARHVAERAGVSPVPGVDLSLRADGKDPAMWAAEQAERIGYPVIVKAIGGGGGIGMQIAHDAATLARALKTCADRARSAFGDDRVYLERYVQSPRHIEVQGLCDASGGAVSLGERECSVQRRHQKIIEESPSPAAFFQGDVGPGRRSALEEAALRVFRSAGYVGAGTCEFIVDGEGNPYFLEVNARLQVEHPVTEMCTGIDLVEQQLRIAAGEKLPAEVAGLARHGHAIEVRLYAEDPKKNFAPQPGRLSRLVWPSARAGLRIETGFRQGDIVTPYYDPLLAKIIAHGDSRAAALSRLTDALAELDIGYEAPGAGAGATSAAGPAPAPRHAQTNLAFLRDILASRAFQSGAYDTHFAEAFAKG